MSSDTENEYFSDGISEEILNALCKLEDLHVTARTSSFAFKGQNLDVREIGKRLNVALILEGSIRKSGDFVRISAQLVNTSDGYHLWSNTWDRELKNIFIIQDEIAADIAEKIKKEYKSAPIQKAKPVDNPQAVELYLKGNWLNRSWVQEDVYLAMDCFNQALKCDPDFAKVYIGLADSYTLLGTIGHMSPAEAFYNVEKNIQKAYELDPDLPEVYTGFAQKKFWHEWDIEGALENLNKSLELKPSNPDALLFKGMLVATYGNFEEALDYLFQSERLSPLSDQINYCLGAIYNLTREFDKAIDYFDKNIKISPRFYGQYPARIFALIYAERYDEAWHDIQNLPDFLSNKEFIAKATSGYYFACRGEKEKAFEVATCIKEGMKDEKTLDPFAAHYLASIYLKLNEYDKALDALEFGIKTKSTAFLYITIDDQWKKVSDDPRFINAINRFKMPSTKKVASRKYKKSSLTDDQSKEIVANLKQTVEKEKLYLNPQLTLSDLAESVDISTNVLSQVLNESIGSNYYDYINKFRLEHFLTLTREPKYKKYTLLSIAYESGFNSKTTFNTFFKKSTGKTPSEYFQS